MVKWKQVKLGDLLHKINDPVALDDNTEYKEITVKLWGQGVTLRGMKLGLEIPSSRHRAKKNYFIMSKIDARHGAFGVIPTELDGGIVTNDFPMYSVDDSILNVHFLDWLSKTESFIDLCKRSSEGTTNRVRIKEHLFLQQTINIPDLLEQSRLAGVLDLFFQKLNKVSELRGNILTDAQSLLHSVFQKIIDGSEYRKISEVAPINRRKVETEIDGKYPELAVRSFGRGIFHKPTLLGQELSWQQLYQIKANDLVISNIKAWEGALAVASDDDNNRFASHRYITCKVRAEVIIADFLCFYLLSPEGIERVRDASLGSADRNRTLAIKRLELIEIPVPPYEKQLQFYELQQKISVIQKAQVENQVELDALLPAMLDKAFNGEL